jgi:murein DD-endopeptidase MepM/ murein hydrolase activator NlpD
MRSTLRLKRCSPFLVMILGEWLLSACAMAAVSTPLVASSPFPILPTQINSPTPLTYTPSETSTFTETFSSSPTSISTEIPSETPIAYTYIFPLQPPGNASFAEGTASHGYPATDIFAEVGTKFVAVTNGVVDFVSYKDAWDPATDDPAVRGGLSVAIIGADGVRYYGSHLSAIANGIKVGLWVNAGQLLGLVGNSGDARSTTSHLHFGISRPSTPEDWKARRGQVDPFPFLQAWKDGHNITPPLPVP